MKFQINRKTVKEAMKKIIDKLFLNRSNREVNCQSKERLDREK